MLYNTEDTSYFILKGKPITGNAVLKFLKIIYSHSVKKKKSSRPTVIDHSIKPRFPLNNLMNIRIIFSMCTGYLI